MTDVKADPFAPLGSPAERKFLHLHGQHLFLMMLVDAGFITLEEYASKMSKVREELG